MVEAPRVVVEHISPSHRKYHVNDRFGCEFEHGITLQRFMDTLFGESPQTPEEAMELLMQLLTGDPFKCSLSAALDELDNCHHSHEDDVIDVQINLAKGDWSIVHKQIIATIRQNLQWSEAVIDVAMV